MKNKIDNVNDSCDDVLDVENRHGNIDIHNVPLDTKVNQEDRLY